MSRTRQYPDVEAIRIRKNLVRFRRELALSQADLANRSGITVDNLRRYEQGARLIDVVTMKAIATVLGHLVDHFFLEDPPPADQALIPRWIVRVTPGMEVDADLDRKVREFVAEVNAEQITRSRSRGPGPPYRARSPGVVHAPTNESSRPLPQRVTLPADPIEEHDGVCNGDA